MTPQRAARARLTFCSGARTSASPLTTVAQHPERLGAKAAELLLERLEGGGPEHGRRIDMPFELVVRQSA